METPELNPLYPWGHWLIMQNADPKVSPWRRMSSYLEELPLGSPTLSWEAQLAQTMDDVGPMCALCFISYCESTLEISCISPRDPILNQSATLIQSPPPPSHLPAFRTSRLTGNPWFSFLNLVWQIHYILLLCRLYIFHQWHKLTYHLKNIVLFSYIDLGWNPGSTTWQLWTLSIILF